MFSHSKRRLFCVSATAVFFLFFISYCAVTTNRLTYRFISDDNQLTAVSLRKFPYPYLAALSISSDIDNTTTFEEFIQIQQFLNTDRKTQMGQGINLEIGNSFLMYAPETCSISYFSMTPQQRDDLISLIQAGFVDFLHSYGEKSDFTRQDAIAALAELKNSEILVDVWVDHAKTVDNFGNDVTFGKGDHPDTRYYHADLTVPFGIKYVWLGRVTMITGQASPLTPFSFTDIFDSNYPLHSLTNISKEFAKHLLAVLGNAKYQMHKGNDLVRVVSLDDGQKVYEFIRFDNYWQGVGTGANASGLAYSLSENNLRRLKEVEGYAIIYTHLGKNDDLSEYLPENTREALRVLSEEYRQGNIWVATTSRILNYYTTFKYLNWSYGTENEVTSIHIHSVDDPVFGKYIPTIEQLQGLCFYVPQSTEVRLIVGNTEYRNLQYNSTDHKDRLSVSIPLQPLKTPL